MNHVTVDPPFGNSVVETRKLTAILAADIVGHSRLTSADEDRTLARVRTLHSELIDPTIAANRGRVHRRRRASSSAASSTRRDARRG
jgi:class 3 adenylate cyclase